MSRERILGIPFDSITMDGALHKIETLLRDEKTHVVTFLTLTTLMCARKNKFIRIFLEDADLIIPCGKQVLWAARFLKRPVEEIFDPSLFVKTLMIQSTELSKNVYLFGGKNHTIDLAFDNLKREIPRLFVIGRHRGNYSRKAHEDVVLSIGKASPDYFFIGIGTPFEERWVERHRAKIHARLIILIGGLFDVFAGSVRKARSYKDLLGHTDPLKSEIPQPYPIRKLWWAPIFIIAVFIEKVLWKH
jgi:N-acetylglucosaminyldiphosphoundecaprenol N-acetyl-beta-D-mannosaminyltransferase